MIQMGKSMPCLYEQMAAVPAMASAQQSGNSNNSSNNSSNNNSNNASQSYEEMLGGSSGAGGMSLVLQGGASGRFQPTPDKIEESRAVDKKAYKSWKGRLARSIGRAVSVSRAGETRWGQAVDVDDRGALLVDFGQGPEAVQSGEGSVRGMYGYV